MIKALWMIRSTFSDRKTQHSHQGCINYMACIKQLQMRYLLNHYRDCHTSIRQNLHVNEIKYFVLYLDHWRIYIWSWSLWQPSTSHIKWLRDIFGGKVSPVCKEGSKGQYKHYWEGRCSGFLQMHGKVCRRCNNCRGKIYKLVSVLVQHSYGIIFLFFTENERYSEEQCCNQVRGPLPLYYS